MRKDINIDPKLLYPEGFLFNENQVSIYNAIMDLPQIESGQGAEEMKYDMEPFSEYQKWARTGCTK